MSGRHRIQLSLDPADLAAIDAARGEEDRSSYMTRAALALAGQERLSQAQRRAVVEGVRAVVEGL